MSHDLTTRIRAYAETIELGAPPVTPDEAQERAGTVATGLIRESERKARPRMVGLAAAAAAILLIGLPVVLLSDGGGSPPTIGEYGAVVDRSWMRVDFAPGAAVKDVVTTDFGLVAAAGIDGVWISRDGVVWRQALVGPYEPPVEPTTTLASPMTIPPGASPMTIPPAEPLVSSDFGAVLEFDGRLYAFGRISVNDPGRAEERGTFAWISDDGLTWDRISVGPFPAELIDAVALGDAIFLIGRDVSWADDDDAPLLSTYIVRSSDGTQWEPVAASGLEGTVLWTVTQSEDGFVALGQGLDLGEQAFVFTSADGIEWLETGTWTISPLNLAAGSQVDLFPSPYGIVAVSVSENHQPTGEPSQIVIAISTDGAAFSVIDTSDPVLLIENARTNRWPPLTPPEGTVFGDRIIMLGVSYPNSSEEPTHHQWSARIDAISPPPASSP